MVIYTKSSIGYSHIEKNVVCQDYSDSYIDNNFSIITACDGHGGKLYIRSDRGSKYASQAVIETIKNHSKDEIISLIENNTLAKVKLEVLCKWNELIEQDYSNDNFKEEELVNLDEDEIFKLGNNFVTAYGSTLNAAIIVDDYVICLQIGDGGVFLLKGNEIEIAFPENDGNVANITNSLCGDKAYNNLFVKAFNKEDYNGIIICTDGLLGPYQTYTNFNNYCIHPLINKLNKVDRNTFEDIDKFIIDLGTSIGSGDDVSLSILYW